jgi:AcrR family transcriptional regulator
MMADHGRTIPTRGAATTKTAQGALSREKILDAAVELIGERGYSATSVDALCRKAGIVKTALYWHFGSKEGLLAAVLERVAGEWTEEIQRSASATGEPLERLDRMLAGLRGLLQERPRHTRLLLSVLLERSEGDPTTRESLKRVFDHAIAAMVQGIEESTGHELADLDLLAHTVLSLVQGTALRSLVDPDGVDVDRYFADIRRTIILLMADRLRAAGLTPPGGARV